MSPRVVLPIVLVLAILAGFFVYPALAEKTGLDFFGVRGYKLGLDLKGGTHLVYQADVSQIAPGDRDEALGGLKNVIEARVNQFGVSEPNITVNKSSHRLIAELAGVLNVNEAIRIIGETPFLEFRELPTEVGLADPELALTASELKDLYVPTELTGRFLTSAALTLDQTTGEPIILLDFNAEGAELFEEITARNVGRPLAIFLDGQSIIDTTGEGEIDENDLYAPIVQEAISGGGAQITGSRVDEARRIVQNLKAGALPLPIELISQQTVGPTLGAESLSRSLFAGLIGFLAVVLYIVLYYRLAGLVAALALIAYGVFTLALFKLIGVTLTLAGVVGFILTLGMAVDANILVFERLKEELKRGREFRVGVNEAFRHAWTAIRDANVSTILTALVLFSFTTSLIKGFALTLIIGLTISVLVAMVVTRAVLRALAGTSLAEKRALWRQ